MNITTEKNYSLAYRILACRQREIIVEWVFYSAILGKWKIYKRSEATRLSGSLDSTIF